MKKANNWSELAARYQEQSAAERKEQTEVERDDDRLYFVDPSTLCYDCQQKIMHGELRVLTL